MNYKLPHGSAAPEGKEELCGEEYKIVFPDLNTSLGVVAMDKDRYTGKCVIIKMSLTEVIFRRKDLYTPPDQTTLKVPACWELKPSRDSGPGAVRRWTSARVDRSNTWDIQFSFPQRSCFLLSLAFVRQNCFCSFLPISFASTIDPNGFYDMPPSWDEEGNGQ